MELRDLKLAAPCPFTPTLLCLDPDLDKLRSDPRFKDLVNEVH